MREGKRSLRFDMENVPTSSFNKDFGDGYNTFHDLHNQSANCHPHKA